MGISVLVAAGWLTWNSISSADEPVIPQWIWFPEGKPSVEAPEGKRYFRTVLIWSTQAHAHFAVACDGDFVLYLNGYEQGRGTGGPQPVYLDESAFITTEENVIAVEATNDGGPAGLLVWIDVAGRGLHRYIVSGSDWKTSKTAEPGWNDRKFDDSDWLPVQVLGPEGQTSPWEDIVISREPPARFQVPDGFRVETFATPEQTGSVIRMTLDFQGRPIISREEGPIYLLKDIDDDGHCDEVIEVTDQITNCQGLCETEPGVLYAIGNGPQGPALYRIVDNDGDHRADSVKDILQFDVPYIIEHGPHAVVYGPDGRLYLCSGNFGQPVPATRVDPQSPLNLFYEGNFPPLMLSPLGFGNEYGAPAGSILRSQPGFQQWSRVAGGFRNEYDLTFNEHAEIFSYDSNMEWDFQLPWYRPVRINHAVPGAEFGWRAGSGKWPSYYVDSLPAIDEVGFGSPTGLIVYRHHQFPERYQNALFLCDWTRGHLLVAHLKRDGGSYRVERETFAKGAPLNVVDMNVAPDGSAFFATGGRTTIGGVYRIIYGPGRPSLSDIPAAETLEEAVRYPQPQSAWARQMLRQLRQRLGDDWGIGLSALVRDPARSAAEKLAALDLLASFEPGPDEPLLIEATRDPQAEVRGRAAMALGDHRTATAAAALENLLHDPQAHVRRRACEALVACGIHPEPEPVIELLADDDRWVRYAARLLLERMPPQRWRNQVLGDERPRVRVLGLVALARLSPEQADLSDLLRAEEQLLSQDPDIALALDVVRAVQLTLLKQGPHKNSAVLDVLDQLKRRFPSGDWRLDREIARVLAGVPDEHASELLLEQLFAADGIEQQIHMAFCLSYVGQPLPTQQAEKLFAWYEKAARDIGGHAYMGYLAEMCARMLRPLDDERQLALLDNGARYPFVARVLVSRMDDPLVPKAVTQMAGLIDPATGPAERVKANDLAEAIVMKLARSSSPEATLTLQMLHDRFPDRRELIVRAVASRPAPAQTELLLEGLRSPDAGTALAAVRGLQTLSAPEDLAAAIRLVLMAAGRLGPFGADHAIRLAEQWSGQNFELAKLGWIESLRQAREWFAEAYPNVDPLPEFDIPPIKKWTYEELASRLLDPWALGSAAAEHGREVMGKARCLDCHKYGPLGQGDIGPELTTLGSRFDRNQIIESLLFPSRVISDQYRPINVITKGGRVINGMPIAQNPSEITLLLSDASKVTLPRSDIEEMEPSTVSVMPEGLLDTLTLEEIADMLKALEEGPPTN